MRWALVLAGLGLALAFGAGVWFARRPRNAARSDRAAPFSAAGLSAPVDAELSDAEIDALPPELPVAPSRRRTTPAATRFRV